MRRLFAFAGLCLMAQSVGAETASPIGSDACRAASQHLARVELFFGVPRPAQRARQSTARNWQDFVSKVVTPRFPDGLTVLDGAGQWRGPRRLEREASRVMIILYRPDPASDGKIEAIRAAYKQRFRQQSVLRVDSTACVSF